MAVLQGAVYHAPDGEWAEVVVRNDVGYQHLDGGIGISFGRRNRIHDGRKEGLQVCHLAAKLGRALTVAGHGIDDREFDLLLGGVQVDEKIIDLIEDLGRPGVIAVNLVDDHDGRQMQFEGFREHEPGLGQRAFGRIDEQHDAVHHAQRALHFAAEVGVTRGIDDVDLGLTILHGRVLGHDGDAFLALEIHRVHDPFGHLLVVPEDPTLPEHGIDEGGLAVVNVSHDGNIAERSGHGGGEMDWDARFNPLAGKRSCRPAKKARIRAQAA